MTNETEQEWVYCDTGIKCKSETWTDFYIEWMRSHGKIEKLYTRWEYEKEQVRNRLNSFI